MRNTYGSNFVDTPLQIQALYDFEEYVTGDVYTTVATDSGTVTVNDEHGGSITIQPSDGTVADNDEIYIKTTKEIFKFADNKPFTWRHRLKVTEANTDDANVLIGVMSAVAANSLLDDAGGPAASYSGAVFFKKDGDTRWSVESSIAGTQSTTETDVTVDGSYHEFVIEWRPVSSTYGEVVFFIDAVQCKQYNVTLPTPAIKHTLDPTSATEMNGVFGLKNGGANNESMTIDVHAWNGVR